jgi:hypothetical protein
MRTSCGTRAMKLDSGFGILDSDETARALSWSQTVPAQARVCRWSIPGSLGFNQKPRTLNLGDIEGWWLKPQRPRFLTPRRKYEVDESKWLVKFGRARWKELKPLALRSAKVALATWKVLIHQGQKVVWFVQWRRMPKAWELSFVSKMKSMEARGIAFQDVLRLHLPSLFGDDTAEVLLRWVGKKARTQPRRFAETATSMFGNSAKPIITSLERLADPDKMLEAKKEVDPPFQSLIEAIQRADNARAELV